MKKLSSLLPTLSVALLSLLLISGVNSGEPAAGSKPADTKDVRHSDSAAQREERIPRVSLAIARDRAKLLHEVYAASLDMMHHRYFHADRTAVPARAMEDVFSDIKHRTHIEARWIAVNLKAMSVDHEPETKFEKLAARELASGKVEVEAVQDGYYYRAGAIPLTSGCISCHGGFFRSPSKRPKYSGLVISIPVDGNAAQDTSLLKTKDASSTATRPSPQ